MMHFKTISELHRVEGLPPPKNPLFCLKQLEEVPYALKNKEITCDFYLICFKKLKTGGIWYGKPKYDHDRGFMYFMKPRQRLTVHDVQLKEKGFSILFHEDYLMGHPFYNQSHLGTPKTWSK